MPAVSGTDQYVGTSILDASQLAGIDTTALKDGDLAYLTSTNRFYHLVKTSTAAADGSSVITTKSGSGRWIIGPSAASGDTLSVPRISDLSALSIDALSTGAIIFVQSVRSYFTLDKTSTVAADGITIAVTPTVGRWFRDAIPSLSWSYQSLFQIEEGTGDDEAVGSVAFPIKTLAELFRRLTINGFIRPMALITATVGSTAVPVTDRFIFSVAQDSIGSFVIKSTRTLVASGTITAFTARNPATNTAIQITDGAQNFAPLVDKLIVITNSVNPASIGAAARILLNVGGTACRCSTFESFDPATSAVAAGTEVVPVVGDAYQVFDQTQVQSEVGLLVGGSTESLVGVGKITVEGFDFVISQTGGSRFGLCAGQTTRQIVLQNCRQTTGSFQVGGVTLINHYSLGAAIAPQLATVTLYGGASKVAQSWSASNTFIRGGFLMQGVVLNIGGTANIQIQDMMSFDWTLGAIQISDGGDANNFGTLSGSSAVAGSYAVQLRSGNYNYNNAGTAVAKHPIAGQLAATTSFIISGNATGPAFDRAAGPPPVFTALRNYTWALLDQTVPGGGFGNAAMDVQSGCAVRANS